MSRWAIFSMVVVAAIVSTWFGVGGKSAAFEILGAGMALANHWASNRSQS